MYTRFERILELDAPSARIAARMTEWAKWSGFSCIEHSPERCVFRRGNFVRAWFTWDIEFLPTRATVEVVGRGPLTVRAAVEVDFANRTSTAAQNEAEVREETGRLVAYLRGVYDFG